MPATSAGDLPASTSDDTTPADPSAVTGSTTTSSEQIQTSCYPLSDTQFQMIERENEQNMLNGTFDTSQDAPGS